MFGIIPTPDLLTYVIIIGMYMVPFIIISATLNKIFKEEKKVFVKLTKGEKDIGRKIELKIQFKPWETIMADTKTHPAFYVKIAIASILSVSVGLLSFSLFSEGVLIGALDTMIIAFAPLLIASVFIHLFSKNLFGPHGWREFLEHTWIALLVITFSISFMKSLRIYVLETYPRQFWERFMGFPFSLHTIMFFLIMLLIGGILIRLSDYFRFEGSPLRASGTTFVLLSVVFLVPVFDIIRWDLFLYIISLTFSISLVFYGIAVSALLYKDAGLRYVVTNLRVIKLNTNRLERSIYYPLVNLKRVRLVQDLLSTALGYGNIELTFDVGKTTRKSMAYCTLYGTSQPALVENTIKAVANLEKAKMNTRMKALAKDRKTPIKRTPIKKTPIKKTPIKRTPIKKTPVKNKKIPVKKKKNFYSRMFVPVFLLSIIITSAMLPTVAADDSLPPNVINEAYTITYSTSSELYINGTIEIYAFTVNGNRMDVHDMKVFAQASPENGEMVEDIILQEVTGQALDLLETGYGIVEDTVGISTDTNVWLDRDSLYEAINSSDPIIAYSNIYIFFESTYYGLEDFTDIEELFMGVLKVGGYLKQDITIVCKEGHTATYDFVTTDNMVFGNGESYFSFSVANVAGTAPIREELHMEIHHVSPIRLNETNAGSHLFVDIHDIRRDEEGEHLELKVNYSAMIHVLPVPPSLHDFIPDQLNLEYINSDLLRLFNSSGLDIALEHYLGSHESRFIDQLHGWGGDAVHDGMKVLGLDAPYDPDNMDSGQPIRIFFNASLSYGLWKRYDGVGAFIPTKFSFSETVSLQITGIPDIPLQIRVMMPEGIQLLEVKLNDVTNEIHLDETGRYYTIIDVEGDDSHTLTLNMGTTVDLMEMLPLSLLILFLFIVWFLLNINRIKKRSRGR